ncbi:MAG: hypothetical protein KatS3mg014_1876 [Actinomycetota bacterium]|nr:MAG: hypothetical protein KatS3mg014_1876 [Actinomycetota bacterium]
MSSEATRSIVPGSTAVTKPVRPRNRNAPRRNSETASTSGTARIRSATSGLNGVKLAAETVRSARSVSSRARVNEASSDAERIVTIVTSARPIMSAEAVAAVRLGLRIAFSRPSRAGIPSPATGRPSRRAAGRATSGERLATPRNTRAAPAPTSSAALDDAPERPYPSGSRPPTVTAVPSATRRRNEPPDGVARPSRSASTGATRPARRAGTTDATRVTAVPARSDTTTVRGRTWSPVPGRSTPKASSRTRRPAPMPTPAPTPTAEARRPTIPASSSTDAVTWRRVAPSARSSASSRVRCAVTMEKVLAITNEPTKREIPAKTRSAVRKNPSASLNASAFSSATEALVTASSPFGNTAWIRSRSSSAGTPSAASTLMASYTPTLSKRSCAVRRSKKASVAPARLSASPKPAIPTISNSPGGPVNRIRTRSPSSRSWARAVAASIATSSGPSGARPCRRVTTVEAGSHDRPIVGGPIPPITWPLAGSTICAYPWTSGRAAATPSTLRTTSSTRSCSGRRPSVPPPPGPAPVTSKAERERTTTSVSLPTVRNSSSKARPMVSVRT